MKVAKITIPFFLSLLLVFSCRKKSTDPPITWTVSGRLMNDCNTPLANYRFELVAEGYTGSGFNTAPTKTTIKDTATDSNGYFKVSWQGKGFSGLDFYQVDEHGVNPNAVFVYTVGVREGVHDYDLGTFYASQVVQHAVVSINYTGSHGPNDTLFIGTKKDYFVAADDVKAIYPISGTSQQSYTITFNGGYSPYPTTVTLFYGIGQRGIDSAYAAYVSSTSSTYNNVKVPVTFCDYSNTATTINIQ